MTKALILAGSLCLSVSAAHACDFMRSADNAKVDKTVVASIDEERTVPMSTPADQTVLLLPSQVETDQAAR